MTDDYVPAQLGDVAHTDDVPLPHVQHRARMMNPTEVLAFVLAGNSRFTLRSAVSGERFTFRVRESSDGKIYFLSLLNRADAFIYCAVINRHDYELRFTKGSKVAPDAPSMVAFRWFWGWLLRRELKADLEFWHEGSCGRCGRALTVPESIIRGLGPTCSKKA